MPGLTAKVFRTYNASNTLQQQLDMLTEPDANATTKLLQYNRANRAVAILCNHQRAPPKTFDKQMTNLVNKVIIVVNLKYILMWWKSTGSFTLREMIGHVF